MGLGSLASYAVGASCVGFEGYNDRNHFLKLENDLMSQFIYVFMYR